MEERDQGRVVFFKRADAIACLKLDGNNSVKTGKVMRQKKEGNVAGAVPFSRQKGEDLVQKWRIGFRAMVAHPQQ